MLREKRPKIGDLSFHWKNLEKEDFVVNVEFELKL